MLHSFRFSLLVPALLATSCGTIRSWQEVQSESMSQATAFDAIVAAARTDGFSASTECDRGLGVWVSRWRQRQLGLGRPGRFRLQVELLLDEGSPKEGWPVRYIIEQQKVKDLKRSMDPRESDWSADGQDSEREFLFGEKLRFRLQPDAAKKGFGDTATKPR